MWYVQPAKAYAQSDQSPCQSLEYSMNIKLLTEHYLEFLCLTGDCTGSSESTLVKMPHCWKSCVAAQLGSPPLRLLLFQIAFIVTVTTYKEPDYGDGYIYKQYAIVVGFFISIIPILPLPIVMVKEIANQSGPLFKVSKLNIKRPLSCLLTV